MSKSKKAIYNAATSIILTLLNGLFSILIIQKVVLQYGSDFNGLNATVSQFVNFLLVIEGGFTLATTVALFSPLETSNVSLINKILSASNKNFKKIGLLFFIVGSFLSFISIIFVKSNLPNYIIFLSFFLTIFSTSINLALGSTYKAILQASQREYSLNIIQIILLIITQILTIFSINMNFPMLSIRVISTIGSLITTLLIILFCKSQFKFVDLKENPDFSKIKGTKDLIVQKITSVLYGTTPILFISMTAGTSYVSVYVIYNSIFSLVKNLIYAVVNAPRSGFGALLSNKTKDEVYEYFREFEFVVHNLLCIILTITMILILPFIKLYTKDINDVNYINYFLPIIMALTIFFEISHIPSGNIINMSGNFKVGKNIQLIASFILIISMLILNLIMGFVGVLIAVLLTAIVLAMLEIYYIHKVFFQQSILKYIISKIPGIMFSLFIIFISKKIYISFEGYGEFIYFSFIISFSIVILFVIFNCLFYRKTTLKLVSYFLKTIDYKKI